MIKFDVIHWLLSGIKDRLIELLPVHVSMRIGIYTVFLSRKIFGTQGQSVCGFFIGSVQVG
jgi:hypothetical protein